MVRWILEGHEHSTVGQIVAVMVSESATAEQVAKHMCQIMGCTLGGEVGLGIPGTVFISSASRVVFMTHSSFSRANSAMELSWGAFVIEKVHDSHHGKISMDVLLEQKALQCQPGVQVVVLMK